MRRATDTTYKNPMNFQSYIQLIQAVRVQFSFKGSHSVTSIKEEQILHSKYYINFSNMVGTPPPKKIPSSEDISTLGLHL